VRTLYLSLAALFLSLAVAGVFLPILPTTPFVLLTSWCLIRSSPALHARLRRSTLFGPLLADWERHHGVRLHVKLSALGVLTCTVALSLGLGDLGRAGRIVLIAAALIGTAVIVRLKTIRED
jgi:hypothetical protein